MNKNDGGPAFPRMVNDVADKNLDVVVVGPREEVDWNGGSPGMSLRDWFAGQYYPMNCAWLDKAGWTAEQDKRAEAAFRSYQDADAMLKAREQ
jgi:hypothetical protein